MLESNKMESLKPLISNLTQKALQFRRRDFLNGVLTISLVSFSISLVLSCSITSHIILSFEMSNALKIMSDHSVRTIL